MSVVHDAYPFYPEGFVADVRPFLESVNMVTGYRLLQDKAIALYKSNDNVKEMCLEYGGWDKYAILKERSGDAMARQENIAFWIVIFLYNHISRVRPHQFGLGNNWSVLSQILAAAGWPAHEIGLVIQGHSFSTLDSFLAHPVWQSVRPFATSASAGWLTSSEVEKAWLDINQVQGAIRKLEQDGNQYDQHVLQSTLAMIAMARDQHSGLCMLASG